MGDLSNDKLRLSILAALSMAATVPAMAQNATPSTAATDCKNASAATAQAACKDDSLDEIVITASAGDKTQLRSSLQVTTITSDLVLDMAPRSTAETLRLIPGMSITDQAGSGGNANFGVRGIPVTTGGAPFVQLQEDGLPTVMFGDMNFGNNDYWTRFDVSNTIEAVVGGNASTLASGAPGAVINFISDTGAIKSGVFTISEGLNFNESKATFAFGGPISDSWRYHVDGFYVYGTGLRNQGFIGEDGYQIKANLTHDLPDDKGYVRFYVKLLDDQEEYNAGGLAIATSNGHTLTSVTPYPGNNNLTGSSVGIYNQSISYLNSTTGTFGTVPNSGVHPIAHAFGAELHLTPVGDLAIDDKFRVTQMYGTFAAQFTGINNSVIGSTVNGQTVGKVEYGAGPLAGQAYTGLIDNSAQIYTDMSNMGSVVNDLALSDKWVLGANKLAFRAGFFYMNQSIDQNWHPNDSYATFSGTNPVPLSLISTSGQLLTNNGVSGYNTNWGTSNDRTYAMQVADSAPYLDLTWDLAGLQLEGSLRHDDYQVSGWTQDASANQIGCLSGGTFSAPLASGNCASLTTPLVSYMVTDQSTLAPLNYGVNYNSWSFGALYQFDSNTSVYGRASRGGKVNTDRNILSGYNNPDGSLNYQTGGQEKALDIIYQQEVGIKRRGQVFDGSYNVTVSYFWDHYNSSNYDLTAAPGDQYSTNSYAAQGLELNGTLSFGGFSLYGQVTDQRPKVTANSEGATPATEVASPTGYLPGGMAKVTYAFVPSYTWGPASGGVVVQGQGQENINGYPPFYSPGYTLVDLFTRYQFTEMLSAGLHVNNLFNKFALGGSGNAITTASSSNVISVNTEPGRTVVLDGTLKF